MLCIYYLMVGSHNNIEVESMICFIIVTLVCCIFLGKGIIGCTSLITATLSDREIPDWKKTRCVMFNVLACIVSTILTGVLLVIYYMAISH